MRRNIIIVAVSLVIIIIAGLLYTAGYSPTRTAAGPPTPDPTLFAPNVAGLGYAIPGDYLTVSGSSTGDGQIEVVFRVANPDPDFQINLVVYIPKPENVELASYANIMPVSKIRCCP